jgi:hypothetical protein
MCVDVPHTHKFRIILLFINLSIPFFENVKTSVTRNLDDVVVVVVVGGVVTIGTRVLPSK